MILLSHKRSQAALLYGTWDFQAQRRLGLALATILLAVSIHAACVGCWGRINSLVMCCPTVHHYFTHTHSISSLPSTPPPSINLCCNLLFLSLTRSHQLLEGKGDTPTQNYYWIEMSFEKYIPLHLNCDKSSMCNMEIIHHWLTALGLKLFD